MSRPAGPWVGGVSELNATLYTCEAWKTVPEINEKNDGEFYVVPIKVLKAQRQVVSGFRTTLEILVGESERPKESLPVDLITAANILLKDNGQRAVYRVAILEKGRNFRKVTAEKVRDVKPSEEF